MHAKSVAPVLSALALAIAGQSASAEVKHRPDPALYGPQGYDQQVAFRKAGRLYERQEYALAIPELDKAIKLQPDFAVALAMRGFSHLALGEFAEAIADHDTVLKLAPDRANSWGNACWARAAGNTDLDKALALCNRAVAMGPTLSSVDYRGFVHFRRGELTQALADYEAALKRERYPAGMFMRGVIALQQGRKADGETDIAWAVKKDPEVAKRFQLLGVEP